MSLFALPVTVSELTTLQQGIQFFTNSGEATVQATAISTGGSSVFIYAAGLLQKNISLSQVAMAVDSLMFGVTDNIAELTKLSTQFLPAQAAAAVAHGYNPTVYAAEALGLALAGGNGTSQGFATNFGALGITQFSQAVAAATGVNAGAIQGFVANWINFYSANPAATFGLSATLAAYGAAFGDAVGVALINPTSANLQALVANALIDNAEGTYAVGTALASLPKHTPLQGETDSIQLPGVLTGPFVLNNVPNGATLVADGLGAGNNLSVHGPGGTADVFTMTANSVQGQDWGTLTFADFENVTLAFTAGAGGFDLDLGPITMTPTPGGGNTLNFTGNANVFVSVGFLPPFGTGAVTLLGGGIINDTDTGVLHFGTTTAAKIVGTTGGGIIMQGIDTSPTGVQEFGSATGWNNLVGSILQDAFTGGKGNVVPGGEGDIFLTNGGADTVNLAPGHSANHIEIYGGTGSQSSDAAITAYDAGGGSISKFFGTGQPGFWGNTTAGATNDIFAAFTSSGTSATQVTINGFNVASDVVDLSVRAWEAFNHGLMGGKFDHGLLQVHQEPGEPPAPASSATGTPAVFTGPLLSGGSVSGSAAGTDVILFGGNFANAASLGASLHINHFGLLALPMNTFFVPDAKLHEIGVYNDVSNNAHIVDIAMIMGPNVILGTYFSDDPNIKVAVSDMAVLVGVNANSLTGDNIHFVS